MIVNVRIEIDDDRRRILAKAVNQKAVKGLATRKDVTAFVTGTIDALETWGQPERAWPPEDISEAIREATITRGRSMTAAEIIRRVREEDSLHDKSDGYCLGWGKVKYAKELRA